MSKGIRLLIVATVVAVAVAVIVLSRSTTQQAKPVPTISAPPCPHPPPKIAIPVWVPKDLPLPKNSYAVRTLGSAAHGGHTAVFVVPGTLQTFIRYVFDEWRTKRGWDLGRGDSEPSEAESVFQDGRGRVGAFRARNPIFCDTNLTELLLYVGTANTG